mgnify:CR=1 FL=1
MIKKLLILSLLILSYNPINAQENADETGAWYMYFWNTAFGESRFGLQGDVQYRDWKIIGDFQQLILRAGATYKVNANIKLVLGYAYLNSGALGESDATFSENRIFQDINLPHKITERIALNHRLRYEQRWIENQDFRTRYRYALFVSIPLNKTVLKKKKSLFLSLSNEVFINGQTDIGNDRPVNYFDRNWLYGAIGYAFTDNLNMQLGMLRQSTTNINKNSLQIGVHHSF